jgi:hypothetical protein
MRVSYAQLLDAANSMVAGVEVWVQAQQQGQVESDIPEVAAAICCERSWEKSWVSGWQHQWCCTPAVFQWQFLRGEAVPNAEGSQYVY